MDLDSRSFKLCSEEAPVEAGVVRHKAPTIDELQDVSGQLVESGRLIGQVGRDPVDLGGSEISLGIDERMPFFDRPSFSVC